MAAIFIIIPVFNEDPKVLMDMLNNLFQLKHQVIVVNDGSTNGLESILKNHPVHFLSHGVNLGQGAALQTGFDYAKKKHADAVITFDADGQHSATDVDALLFPLIKNQTDVALGSRFLPGQQSRLPAHKKLVLHSARFINFLFTGLLLSDAHNGLRAFNKKALDKIHLTENKMAHASEILFEIKKHKLRFKEIPVNICYSNYTREKGQSSWDSIKILFDLILHKFFK